ncbi:hypothetical protein [Paraburkholderia sp. LEh10]|jgi:hypothetical protein|nr:hypothetical protein [Paraburkholderia sp. LEh10]
MEIDILGIDLAKHVFQFHGADRRGRKGRIPLFSLNTVAGKRN